MGLLKTLSCSFKTKPYILFFVAYDIATIFLSTDKNHLSAKFVFKLKLSRNTMWWYLEEFVSCFFEMGYCGLEEFEIFKTKVSSFNRLITCCKGCRPLRSFFLLRKVGFQKGMKTLCIKSQIFQPHLLCVLNCEYYLIYSETISEIFWCNFQKAFVQQGDTV